MSGDGNVGQQFDRLPETPEEQEIEGRASRQQVVNFWHDRYGVPKTVFSDFTLWEKGAGKIWMFGGDVAAPISIEGLGMKLMRTRQEHWKPTTNAAQRFGRHATKNVIVLDADQAERFAHGTDVDYPDWDGDWGYLIAAHELAGVTEPIGVGLYLHGELRSVVPKGRQFD